MNLESLKTSYKKKINKCRFQSGPTLYLSGHGLRYLRVVANVAKVIEMCYRYDLYKQNKAADQSYWCLK